MIEEKNDVYLMHFKKKIYFLILPFVIVATGMGWLLDGITDHHDIVNYYLFPLLDIWLIIVLFLLIFKDHMMKKLEGITITAVSVLYLSWFIELVFFNTEIGHQSGGLGEITNWIPLYYISIFLIFTRRTAVIYAVTIFVISFMIGMSSIVLNPKVINKQAVDTLLQFYLSNAAYLFSLYFLQHLKEAFIHKETMQTMANTDYLTGLPNRRMLETRLKEFLTQQSVSAILLDVDHFKQINDTFGHEAGDTVLKELAELLKDNIRNTDVFGRWGGEEFLILLPEVDEEGAMKYASRLRMILEDSKFSIVQNVTGSFGVTTCAAGCSSSEVLKSADIALYNAKQHGRNQVQMH